MRGCFNTRMFTEKRYYLKQGKQGIVTISGTIRGDIIGAKNVIVASTGFCNCNINAKNLIIYGAVEGNIDVETLIIDAGKLYYNYIKMDRLLIGEQGFIAHKSDVQTKKIPENFDIMKIDEMANGYEKLSNKIGVNLRHFKLYFNNATRSQFKNYQNNKHMGQNTIIENTRQNTKYKKYNDINVVEQFYSSF